MSNDKWPQIEDFNVFLTVIRTGSFSAAAADLGLSNAYVTKRINILENILSVKLFHRDTRNIQLTSAGEVAKVQAEIIIKQSVSAIEKIQNVRNELSGSLHVCSSFGFGTHYLSSPFARFSTENKQLKVKLTLTDNKLDLVKEGIDLEISVGNEFNENYYARKIASNKRILCASPLYLTDNKLPVVPGELSDHNCLFLHEKGQSFGVWRLYDGNVTQNLRVEGNLSSNNGEIIVQWALSGHGIAYRSQWDVQKYIDKGLLTHILPDYYEEASVWAVYPNKLEDSLKTKKCVEFLEEHFRKINFQADL